MSRPTKSSRAVWLIVAALLIPVSGARAQEPEEVQTVEITSSPESVRFRGTAVLHGKLEGAVGPQKVTLERRWPSGTWAKVATRPTDDRGRVRFRVEDLSVNSYYRMFWADPASADRVSSRKVLVEVRPRLTLKVKPRRTMLDHSARVKGVLRPALAGRRVVVEQRRHGDWVTLKRLNAADGRFSLRHGAQRIGVRKLRVRFGGDGSNLAATRRGRLTVYDPALATWYGPGFYGNSTACGQTLQPGTLGVAHKYLKCGTKVDILFQGRTISVQVIDRGPYSGADYDLTEATAERLHFDGRRTIGVVRG